MSHSLAPWSIPHFANGHNKCQCRYVFSENYCGAVCTIHVNNGLLVGEGGNDDPPLEEAIANARLIAAAPDLLAALKRSLPVIIAYGVNNESVQMVERAIAKATGAP